MQIPRLIDLMRAKETFGNNIANEDEKQMLYNFDPLTPTARDAIWAAIQQRKQERGYGKAPERGIMDLLEMLRRGAGRATPVPKPAYAEFRKQGF